MPYPTTHPDPDLFEPVSHEYASISAHDATEFIPLTSSEMLVSLVQKGDFQAAESLRKEMISHNIPIQHHTAFRRAALHEITEFRPKGSGKKRLESFEAWLSLVPDRHVKHQPFQDIRHRIFRDLDHLNLSLVYRFGIVLASKGYRCSVAMQVVLTIARHASPSIVDQYLRDVEEALRLYQSRTNTSFPSIFLSNAYDRAARIVATRGKTDAAFHLISIARSRNLDINDFTLTMIAEHASDQQLAIDHIRELYPSWPIQDADALPPTGAQADPLLGRMSESGGDDDPITTLAARLRSLRNAFRSPSPPSPRALQSFITSYRSLKRTRAIDLLSSVAYRHSPKSAATWAFTEMLHHRSRREHIHVLLTFFHHFQPIGVPRQSLVGLVRGPQGRQARQEPVMGLRTTRYPIKEKLWPSASHTALVWESIVRLSHRDDREKLYRLLLTLIKRSKQSESSRSRFPNPLDSGSHPTRIELSPNTFSAAHFTPFISVWLRGHPERAGEFLRDMVNVGIPPTLIQWSIFTRSFAQHGDPDVVFRILDQLGERRQSEVDDADPDPDAQSAQQDTLEELEPTSDKLLGLYTNALRGFVIRGDVKHAQEVEKRLVERLGYQVGDRPITDANIMLLRNLEAEVSHDP